MRRSDEDIDHLLRDWDRVVATARQPIADRPRTVALTASVPVSLVLVAALAVAVVAIVGRGSNGGPAASPSAGAVAGGAVSDVVDDGEFRLTLTADRASFLEGEAITAEATVEYVGARASRTVSHAGSPVTFSVTEVDGQRHVDGAQDLVLKETTYERGVTVTYPWTKSGGTSGDDANDPFVRWYLAQDRLVLPAGTWRLGVTFADTRAASVTVRVAAGVAGETPSPARAVIRDDTFELGLTLDRERYTAGQDILGEATVTYLGPDADIRVSHGGSPVLFSVREVGGTREAPGGMDTPCLRSTWARGVAQPFPWSRSGGYSNTNPTDNDRFVADYLEDGPPGGLRLPAGTWTLGVTLLVTPGGTCADSQPMTVDLTITVDPATAAGTPSPAAVLELGPVVRCVRVEPGDCEGAAALARDLWPDAYRAAELVLVVDSCATDAACDRQYPFDALVVFLPNAGVAMGQTILVHGTTGPEVAEPTQTAAMMTDELDALAGEGFGDGLGGILFPLRVSPPSAVRTGACRTGAIDGVLVEDPRSGIALRAGGQTMPVTWPFGWAGRRSDNGVELVTIEGLVVGSMGDEFLGAGSPADRTVCAAAS